MLLIGLVGAAALGTGCGSSTRDRVQQDASRTARVALQRAGISTEDQTGPMSCAEVKGKRQSVWRCSADLVSGAQVQCEVHFPSGKAKPGRTSCGGTLAVNSRTLSY